MADRDRQRGDIRFSRGDGLSSGEWQQWPEEAFHQTRGRTPAEDEWEQWPGETRYEPHSTPQLGEEVWEKLPEDAFHGTQALSLAEDEWERWPELTINAHQTSPQPEEEIWEELPEDAMREPQTLPSEETIYQSLDASVHPALRSSFKIQENWDRAPEMVSPMMTGANPHAAAFSPLPGETADEGPQDQTAHGERRRHRSRVPSPELSSRHRHRRHYGGALDDMKPDSPVEKEPRHRHRSHRRHRSRTSENKAGSADVIGEAHTRNGSHSRHVHFLPDRDADTDDQGEKRTRHRTSSRHPRDPGVVPPPPTMVQSQAAPLKVTTKPPLLIVDIIDTMKGERRVPSPELQSRFRRPLSGHIFFGSLVRTRHYLHTYNMVFLLQAGRL